MPPVATFRIPFWRLFIPMLVFGQAIYWLGMGLVLLFDVVASGAQLTANGQLVGLVVGSVAIAVLMLPAALLMAILLPVRVSADGFTCPNGFGKLVTVPWESIRTVKRFTFPAMPYLLVKTDRSWLKLWLPLFLHRLPELAEKLEVYAGSDHVLYRAVWPAAEKL